MIKETILLIFVIILALYLVVKSIIFKKKYRINPVLFTKNNIKESLPWYLIFIVSILYFVLILYFNKTSSLVKLDYLGFLILLLGFIVMVIAHIQMGSSWRMGFKSSDKINLIQSGIFKFSRNPVYLGLLIQAFAILLLISNLWSLLLFLALFIILRVIISKEEEFLEKQFGKEYTEYKKKVRRFI